MRAFTLLVLFGCAALAAPAKSDAEAIAAAQKVAKAFLAAVDAGNARSAGNMGYDIEHKDPKSGRVKKRSITAYGVTPRIDSRKRLGKLIERTLEKTIVSDEVSGSFPRGKYVQFVYNLSFEDKTRQIESITIKVDAPQAGKVVAFH